MNLEELKRKMDEEHYIYDDTLSTVLYVALQLGRPLLIEGAAGVGKTEVAKVMAAALDRELVRLQCYEGLDESKALYEWNYQKQLLSIQVNMNAQDREALTRSLFSDEYLLERPLLKSIRSEKPVVLLIDEIDKADEEFEAFLLELLSEMQVTIPEVGTIRANSVPFVVLTSNRARPLSEALRRRCAYLYIGYPDMEKELAILRAKLPHVDDRLCAQVLQRGHSEKALHCGDAGLGGGAGRSRHPGADPRRPAEDRRIRAEKQRGHGGAGCRRNGRLPLRRLRGASPWLSRTFIWKNCPPSPGCSIWKI